MKKEYKIQLNSQQEQAAFVKMCCSFAFDVNLYKGSYVVDAKSLLGVCSMDTTNGCIVKIQTSSDMLKKFEEKISEYIE